MGEKKFSAIRPCLEDFKIFPDFNRTVEAEIEKSENNNSDYEIIKIRSAEKLPGEK